MPTTRRRSGILRVDHIGEGAVERRGARDGDDTVLRQSRVTSDGGYRRCGVHETHGGMSAEVGDGNKLARVGIDEGLVPRALVIIADLDCVGQGGTTIGFGEIFDGRSGEGLLVKLAVEGFLSGGDSSGSLDLGSLGRDPLWNET